MTVILESVSQPCGSAIALGHGIDPSTGNKVAFCGDHRPMRDLAERVHIGQAAPVFAEIDDWQLIRSNGRASLAGPWKNEAEAGH